MMSYRHLCTPPPPAKDGGMQRKLRVERFFGKGQPKRQENPMPRGDKSSYSQKQKRKAAHIESGYRRRGVSKKEAERRAWATVNEESGGGNKSGSGRGKPDTKTSSRRGGKLGGKASARRAAAARKASARKAAATRARRSGR
jgi:plasmid stabilization system protein ParE